jgi:hypothetical protein
MALLTATQELLRANHFHDVGYVTTTTGDQDTFFTCLKFIKEGHAWTIAGGPVNITWATNAGGGSTVTIDDSTIGPSEKISYSLTGYGT